MWNHLHAIGLIGVTELGTVTFHLAPNRRRFHWSISRWIMLGWKNIFGKSLKSNLSLFVPRFSFSTVSEYYITILVSISHGNRSPTSHTIRGQRPISGRTYFRHICSMGVNVMQLWFFVSNRFLIYTLNPSPDFLVNSYTQNWQSWCRNNDWAWNGQNYAHQWIGLGL